MISIYLDFVLLLHKIYSTITVFLCPVCEIVTEHENTPSLHVFGDPVSGSWYQSGIAYDRAVDCSKMNDATIFMKLPREHLRTNDCHELIKDCSVRYLLKTSQLS